MKVEMVEIGKLQPLRGNRAPNMKHVEKLKKAILKKNLLHLKPILINSKHEVLDGQHRILAATELGILTLPCICMEQKVSLEDVQAINLNSKGWTIMDYARSYASQGSREYAAYLEFTEHSKIPASECIALLKHGSLGNSGRHIENFRKGIYKVTSLKFAHEFDALIRKVEPEFAMCWKRSFLRAMLSLVRTKGFDIDILVHQLGKVRLKNRASARDYIDDLNEIYNKQLPKEKRLEFKFLATE